MFQKAVKRSFAVLLSLTLALTLMVPAVFAQDVVQSVTILNPVDKLVVGESVQLLAEVEPEGNVDWTSSNESVLKVSQDGVVEAVGAGTAKIRASAQTEDMVFDTCEIKVVERPIFKTDKDTYEPNETITVTAQTDYNVEAVLVTDEQGNELNRIKIQSSIQGDYKEWNIKVSIADAGSHTILVMGKTRGSDAYEELARLSITIAGGSGEPSEPDTSKPDSSTPDASEPDVSDPDSSTSTPDESNPDSSNTSSSSATSSSSTAGAGTSSSRPSGTSSHNSSSKNPSTGESTPLFAMLGLAAVAGATMIIMKKREQK